jgi:hypothetical protein
MAEIDKKELWKRISKIPTVVVHVPTKAALNGKDGTAGGDEVHTIRAYPVEKVQAVFDEPPASPKLKGKVE